MWIIAYIVYYISHYILSYIYYNITKQKGGVKLGNYYPRPHQPNPRPRPPGPPPRPPGPPPGSPGPGPRISCQKSDKYRDKDLEQ